MENSLLKLILSMNSNPGVYALLLGSGISRSAGIPTGWEIVRDLISKLATALGEKMEPDAETWYKNKFGHEPKYSDLLEKIAPTPAERSRLLQAYFEPNEEEREQGLKLPTAAHKSIAALVKNGNVKMILTTNFDRLLEIALEEQGITPDVISSDDMLAGSVPFVHSKCTILKLHGDYRDTRIKNTPEELATYTMEMNKYLDRILDEFGLIVCGWSGEWDIALRDALFRCPSRRFTSYWSLVSEPRNDTKRIIEHRRSEIITIKDANTFFIEVLEKVQALEDMRIPDVLSCQIAIATTKRLLSEEKYRIRLHDLITNELEKAYKIFSSDKFEAEFKEKQEGWKFEFQTRMNRYETACDILMGILGVVSYFDKGANSEHISKCIERLLVLPRNGGKTVLLDLQKYPALLINYVVGISSVAANNYNILAAALLRPKFQENGRSLPGITALNVWDVFNNNMGKWVPIENAERKYTPVNEYLQRLLRERFRNYIPSDKAYESIFDIFEYLLALVYVDLISPKGETEPWGPLGCFCWRYRNYNDDKLTTPIKEFFSEGVAQGNSWGLLSAGFFGGSIENLNAVRDRFDKFVISAQHSRW